MLDTIAENFGIKSDFIEASNHPYYCRCDKCRAWWAGMGPDGDPDADGAYGPFTKEEIEYYQTKEGEDNG